MKTTELKPTENVTPAPVGSGDWLGSVFEYACMAFMGVAILGATGKYTIALGVLIPGLWMHEKNKRIRQLERVVKINSDFWEKADSSDDGEELIQSMRELCKAVLPNNRSSATPEIKS